jgi:hypothetical protein
VAEQCARPNCLALVFRVCEQLAAVNWAEYERLVPLTRVIEMANKRFSREQDGRMCSSSYLTSLLDFLSALRMVNTEVRPRSIFATCCVADVSRCVRRHSERWRKRSLPNRTRRSSNRPNSAKRKPTLTQSKSVGPRRVPSNHRLLSLVCCYPSSHLSFLLYTPQNGCGRRSVPLRAGNG